MGRLRKGCGAAADERVHEPVQGSPAPRSLGPLPTAPPALPFFGDVIALSAGTAGGMAFSSTGVNAPSIVAELLIQPLASRNRRTYPEKYRHAAFVDFPAATAHAVPCEAGQIACAYRFVNAATGQVSDMAELGVFRAG